MSFTTLLFHKVLLFLFASGSFVWQSVESFTNHQRGHQRHVDPTSRTPPSISTFQPQDYCLSSRVSISSSLYGIRCENKFYQLEEKEDGETSRTEVYLMADRQVDFGKTDGPVPDYVEGTWHVELGTDDFTMQIRRVFGTGKKGSDMGEFSFEIIRELRGDMTMVGESVAITGVIINKDDLLGDKGKQNNVYWLVCTKGSNLLDAQAVHLLTDSGLHLPFH